MQTSHGLWVLIGENDESGSARQVPVNAAPFRVGRGSDLQLSLSCLTVSKVHAELFEHAASLYVRDLRSTNGTFVNGHRVQDELAVEDGDLLQFGNVVFQVDHDSPLAATGTIQTDASIRAEGIRQFDRLMRDRAVLAHFQPIVEMRSRTTVGYEVLGRSVFSRLDTPKAMFQAAAAINVEAELSCLFRLEGIKASANLPGSPNLFLNTHPVELECPGLLKSLAEIRECKTDLRMTLEIHEAMVTDAHAMTELRAGLRDIEIQLAYDDFGAGQSRLAELFAVPPDYLKFDMSLVQGIHRASDRRRRMLATLVAMVRDAGIVPLAEGIECEEDSAACSALGFELAQGYHFGRSALAIDCATR